MRGDIVFRVYGVHGGRGKDTYFGAFRTRAEAEAHIVELGAREMHGRNWAAQYHDQGFVIREHAVDTDFEPPSRPKPRDKYFVEGTPKPNAPGTWDSTLVEVFRRHGASERERVCIFERDYALLQTFEPFRQGTRELALISRHYTRSAVLDLATGEILAEESESTAGSGFCPVGFYVPDWWDLHDSSIIPGSEYWSADLEWPVGDFGFVWGCHWGDDRSWKVQYLDLRRIQEGIIARDDRFGYVELATTRQASAGVPDFIEVSRRAGVTRVCFAVELSFDLETGRVDEKQVARLGERDK